MNIRVQVLAAQARRAIAQVEGDLTRLQARQAAGNAASMGMMASTSRNLRTMRNFGNQIQWTGRQLQYNWTLPILAAAAAGAHFQMENEKAMTRVAKVYGDASMKASVLKNELGALEGAFEALSEKYGIVQSETIGIAAEWAAAGSSGIALAKQTDLTMKTMVLGQLEAAEATQALIAIQAQFNQSSDELGDTIARLNNVENQTGTTMGDLIISMSRSAGVARAAGVDVAHLAAMTAALVPAAGTAAQAGNALKTIISRLLSPTGEAAQILNEMGIAISETAWKSANATTRIELLSAKYQDLSDSQKAVVSATLASRYQINKFEVLMEAIARRGNEAGQGMSFYWTALAAATNRTEYLQQVTKELNTVLDSNPKKWDRIKVIMQNTLANAMQPLLPWLISIGQGLAEIFRGFGDLSPVTQKWIGAIALLLIVLPLMTRYLGSLISLMGVLASVLFFALTPLGFLLRGLRLLSIAAPVTFLISALGTTLLAAGGAVWVAAVALAAFSKYIVVLPALIALVIKAMWILFSVAVTFGPGLIVSAFVAMGTALTTLWAVILPSLLVAWRAFAITASVVAAIMSHAIRRTWTWMWLAMYHTGMVFSVAFTSMWAALTATMAIGLRGPFSIMLALAAGFGAAFTTILWHIRRIWQTFLVAMWFLSQGMWASMWAMLGAITVAGGATLGGAFAAVAAPLVAVFTRVRTALAVVWATLGPILSAIWIAISVSLSVIMAQTSRGLVIIWQSLMLAMEAILIAFATAAGIIWRAIPLTMAAGLRGPWSIILALTSALMVAMSTIFAAGWVAIQHIIVAGAAAAGIIWRNAMVLMALLTLGLQKTLAVIWTGITKLWAMRLALITAITWTWGSVIVPLMTHIGRLLVIALSSPWTWLAIIVATALYALRDQIVSIGSGIWNWLVDTFDSIVDRIISAFNSLPQGVQNAFNAVISFIAAAARQIAEWLSYLNPWARHSPSLVDNVNSGMAAVVAGYGGITAIKGPIDSAAASIQNFKSAAASLAATFNAIEVAKDRKLIAEFAPGLLGQYDQINSLLAVMRVRQDALAIAVKAQERVVAAWQDRLDAANDALDAQRDKLDALQAIADGYRDRISALNDAIDRLASTPITGMGAMEDALFANQMAQKRLRLEMLKTGEEGGMSYDDIRNKLSLLAGEMESLTGRREELRGMGAGSEILSHYDQQIEALDAQRDALEDAEAPVNQLQNQLDELQRQAEIMDLEKALKFDPLTRAIDQAANAMAEMPFNQIIGQIRANQAAIDALTPGYNRATAAVDAQEQAVKRAQAAVDAIQASYDAESKKLEQIRDLYQETADAVRDMEGALGDARGAASGLKQAQEAASSAEGYISPALQNFRDAEGGNFADVSGSGMVGREMPGIEDQSALIDQFTADIAAEAGSAFSDIDMFGPLKDMWNDFYAWATGWLSRIWKVIRDFFGNLFEGVDIMAPIRDAVGGFDFTGVFSTAWKTIKSVISTVWQFAELLWELIGPDIADIVNNIIEFFGRMGRLVGQVWDDITDRIQPFLEAINNLWEYVLKPFAIFMIGVFLAAIKTAFTFLKNIAEPVLRWLGDMFEAVWKVIKGILDVFIGIFTGDWKRFWEGIKSIFSGIWDAILATIRGILGVLWGIIKSVLELIGKAFHWLWDNAIEPVIGWISAAWDALGDLVGWVWRTLIKPIWDAISAAFRWLWDNALKPIFDAINKAWNALGEAFKWVYNTFIKPIVDAFKSVIDTLKDSFQTAVDTISRIWEGLKNALMAPVQWVIDFVWNNGLMKLWNWINNLWGGNDLEPFRLASGGIWTGNPQRGTALAKGGVMPGYTPGRDVHNFFSPTGGLLALSGGEAVMRPEFTRAVGSGWVDTMNSLARQGGASAVGKALTAGKWQQEGRAYASGGVIGIPGWAETAVALLPGGGLALNAMVDAVNNPGGSGYGGGMWGEALFGTIEKVGTAVWDAAKSLFDSSSNISGGEFAKQASGWPARVYGVASQNVLNSIMAIRYGFPEITSVGTVGSRPNASDHPWGKAADFMIPGWDTTAGVALGNKIANTLMSRSLVDGLNYVIWNDKISSGSGWEQYTHPNGATTNATLRHLDHVHASYYDDGGMWKPGSMGINQASGPERVLSPRQTLAFEKLIAFLDRDGVPSMARMESAIFRIEARVAGAATIGQQTIIEHQGDNNVTVNMNGDLVFPNITDGGDAKVFLRNLGDLAGRK